MKFKDFSRTFKAMYQQIQGLNTEEKGLEISKSDVELFKTDFNDFQTALSDMNMQNQSNKMSVLNVKQFQKISRNKSKKNLRTFKHFFTNSRTFKALNFVFKFKDIQGLSSFVRTLVFYNVLKICLPIKRLSPR